MEVMRFSQLINLMYIVIWVVSVATSLLLCKSQYGVSKFGFQMHHFDVLCYANYCTTLLRIIVDVEVLKFATHLTTVAGSKNGHATCKQ